MPYYRSNAVYDQLDELGTHPFHWVSGNAWLLIYGDAAADPKALVFARGTSWNDHLGTGQIISTLLQAVRLPYVGVVFDDRAPSIDSIILSTDPESPGKTVSLTTLKEHFRRLGLPVSTSTVRKSVNDRVSSAYQKWQRESLGGELKVSDIDLLRVRPSGEVVEIIELKRSYYSIEEWSPFQADYVNFDLILKTISPAGIALTIAYNVRKKTPKFLDDPSTMKLYRYAMASHPELIGVMGFDDFVRGEYLAR